MHALYMTDSYLKEFTATVKSAKDGKYVVLDRTAFYPSGGGQPHDTGFMERLADGKRFHVVFTGKFSGEISHEVSEPGLKEGDEVKGTIDWERRHKLMRYHTAAHIIAGIIHEKTGAMITGNQLDADKSRIDFSIEHYDQELIRKCILEADDKAAGGAEVRMSFITPQEAAKNPNLSRLAKGLPPGIKEIRMVDICGIDCQADGGTHVKNTREIGKIEFLRCENKGKDNRRVYFSII